MSKFLSGRIKELLLGVVGRTEDKTVLQTTGTVGIGTTNSLDYTLYVNGSANIDGGVNVTGISTFKDSVIFDSTNSIQIPVGVEGEKDAVGVAVTGQVRFNTTNQQFEGFGVGNNWGSLGGVKDVDGDTEIKAELSAGSDEDNLYFYNGGYLSATISSTAFTLNVPVSINSAFEITGVTTFTNTTDNTLGNSNTGAVQIDGGLGVDKNVTVGAGLSVVSGFNVAGVSTFQGNVNLGDNDKLKFGTGDDLQIYHDSSNNGSYIKESGSGNLFIQGSDLYLTDEDGTNMVYAANNAGVSLYYGGGKNFETISIGVSVSNGTSDTATIAGPTNLILDPAAVGDNTGIVRIKGDLYVDGTEVKVDSTTINLADLKIGIATNTATSLLLDGGGIGIGSTNIEKTILWNHSNSRMEFNANLFAPNLTTGILDVNSLSPDGSDTGGPQYLLRAVGDGTWEWAEIPGIYSVNNILNGFTAFQEGVVAGTAGSITSLDFVGGNVLISADPQPNGIATVTLSPNPVFTTLNITGISTLGGPVTAGTSEGISGQYLRNVGTGVTWASFPTLRTTQTTNATNGQTTFNFNYNTDFLDVFINGVKLTSSEYTASNGTSVVLSTPAFVNDVVELHSYNTTSTGASGSGATNLNGLTDTTISSLADDHLLQYNSSTNVWENVAVTSLPFASVASVGLSTVGLASQVFVGLSTAGLASQTFVGLSTVGLLTATGDASNLTGLTGASAATYGDSTTVSQITVDADGRITSITDVAISGGSGGALDKIQEGNTNAEVIDTGIDGRFTINTNGVQRLIVDPTGDVGIGTTIPTSKLEINVGTAISAFDVQGSAGQLFSVTNNLTTGSIFSVNDVSGIASIDVDADGTIQLAPYGTLEKVGIGITNPTSKLHIVGDTLVTGVVTATKFVGIITQVTVADESTDTTCFPLFVTAATGNLPPKSGSNLAFNSSTGQLTATKFSGDGSLLTNVSAGATDVVTVADESSDTTCFPLFVTAATGNLSPKSGSNLAFNSSTGQLTATKFSGDGSLLTDLPAADTDVQVTYDISSNSSSAYLFTGPGYSGADDNPDLYLVRGQRYRFINTTGTGHPFRIQSDTSGTAYTDGVSGDQDGTQDFNVQHDAPVRLYYQCTIHSGMIGNIYVVGASDWRMTNVATNATPEIFTNLNVGIGTTNTGSRLHVKDTVNQVATFETTLTSDMAIELKNSQGNMFFGLGGGEEFAVSASSDLNNVTDNHFVIKQTGLVGINELNPDAQLHIKAAYTQNDANGYLKVQNTQEATNSGSNTSLVIKSHNATSQFMNWEDRGMRIGQRIIHNSSTGDLYFTAGNDTVRLTINASNGNFTGSSSADISDGRLKENIQDISASDAVTIIKGLQGRTFTWKEEAKMGTDTKYGFIAQEVETVIPNLVHQNMGINRVSTASTTQGYGQGEIIDDYSDAYKDDTQSEWSKSVEKTGIIPVLVEALKDAFSKIETLETQNTSLEARLTALEG